MANNRLNLIFIPFALMGILGFSLALLVISQFLGIDSYLEGLTDMFMQIGLYLVNLSGAGIEPNNAFAFLGLYLGFGIIPLILVFWLLFLTVGWFYEPKGTNKIAIKQSKWWLLAFLYYPLCLTGVLTLILIALG